ncbi:MAG TPA: methyltransferase domain-containing protein [Acidimicrobiia bacterium]|nr:methyltransferase domain-containing protein [Acidimicrobiia bacterium]
MRLRLLQSNWNRFARRDALWAICTEPERSRRRWNVAEFFETGRRDVDHIFEMTKALGLDVPTGRALDFGCGVGRLTQSLATRFDEVVGVDLAPAMVVQADSHNRHTQRCATGYRARSGMR